MNNKIFEIAKSVNKELLREPVIIERIGKTFCFVGSITWIHAPSGYGKSYQTVKHISDNINEDTIVLYFDGESGNGSTFKKYCEELGVYYFNATNIHSNTANICINVSTKIKNEFKDKNIITILDSFSSMFSFQDTNVANKFVKELYQLGSTISNEKISLVIIDHSTKINDTSVFNHEDRQYKLEGNEEGKKRVANVVLRYTPINIKRPQDGGSFVVEKSRHPSLYDEKLFVDNNIILNIVKYILKINEKYKFNIKNIKRSELTRKILKNKPEYKEYIYEIFDSKIDGKTEYLSIKKNLEYMLNNKNK